MIEKLKKGEIVQRLITYMGHRIVEHFQPNKEHPGTYDRYYLPANRNRKYAIMLNYALQLFEVEFLLSKTN